LASHVIGFVDAEHKGVQGIEASMEDYLQGQPGYEVIERDRKGREIRALRTEDIGPRDGFNVVLTIDQMVQHIAEQELEKAMAEFKPQAGVIIVSRPKTGEILAMSSRPTFDPTNMDAASADDRRNRCISDVAEPGSTFKIVVCSGALNEGIVTLNDQFDCENGAFMYAGRILHDAHPFGVLSVEEILFHSSNIGAAKVALRMGPVRLADYIHRYGFGHKTGIELPGEVSGIAHPLAKWNNLSITRIPMGHEIAVTPIQMLMAMNAIANNGVRMKPLIVRSIVDTDGTTIFQYRPEQVGQVVTPRACQLMTAALRKVVSPEGTAPKAALEGFDVAGKTGTAQKVENGQYVSKYYSSFIGYFPASNPEISILVSLDDPSGGAFYGGSVAGPVFRAVAEKVAEYLGMEPQTPRPEVSKLS
jgi:cell division protein FtsI/penicillin-binding protein 2